MDRLAILAEDSKDVALGEIEGETAYIEPGGVAVIGVPGGFWGAVNQVKLDRNGWRS